MLSRFWILFALTVVSNTWLVSSNMFSWGQQLDRWLAFTVLQLLLTVPLVLIEYALTARAQEPLLQGFDRLTREADVTPKWRILPWASILGVTALGSVLVYQFTVQAAKSTITGLDSGQTYLLVFSSIVLMLALSLYRTFAVFLSWLALVLAVIWQYKSGLIDANSFSTTWTAISWEEWTSICIFAMMNLFLFMGFYSYTRQNTKSANIEGDSPTWLIMTGGVGVQLVASLVAQGTLVTASGYTWLFLWLCAAAATAMLFNELYSQYRHKGYSAQKVAFFAVLAVVISIALFYLPIWIGVLWAAATLIAYCIFAGWKMKISHLRKTLNFSSEWQYNLWRIAVRIVVPLIIASAFVTQAITHAS